MSDGVGTGKGGEAKTFGCAAQAVPLLPFWSVARAPVLLPPAWAGLGFAPALCLRAIQQQQQKML